jgi:hypothetical protein
MQPRRQPQPAHPESRRKSPIGDEPAVPSVPIGTASQTAATPTLAASDHFKAYRATHLVPAVRADLVVPLVPVARALLVALLGPIPLALLVALRVPAHLAALWVPAHLAALLGPIPLALLVALRVPAHLAALVALAAPAALLTAVRYSQRRLRH